jgi:Zn-dependent M16 (insulinase) family peptidase
MNRKLIAWQNEEDTPEQKATLPALHLDDLKKTPTRNPYKIYEKDGVTIIDHPNETDGISYNSLIICADDLNEEEITIGAQLTPLLGNLATANYDALSLNRTMKSILGDFSASFTGSRSYVDGKVKRFVVVFWSNLKRNDEEAIELIKEILYRTDYRDLQAIRNILKQNIFGLEQAYINAGNGLAVQRAASYTSSVAANAEYAKGYEAYRYLKDLDGKWDEKAERYSDLLKALAEKLFVKERYTLSIAGEDRIDNIGRILKDAPHGTIGERYEVAPLGKKNEGIAVPANISYAAKSSMLDSNKDQIGTMFVLSNILTYDYLWTNIRVKGGAYGCGFRSGIARSAGFYSFRDPNPANSLNIYKETVDYLKQFLERTSSIENYIVGTTGEFDPLLSAKGSILTTDMEYMMDYSYEDKCRILDQILGCDLRDIEEAIRVFEYVNEDDNVCVIGNKAALEKCGDALKTIFDFSDL